MRGYNFFEIFGGAVIVGVVVVLKAATGKRVILDGD